MPQLRRNYARHRRVGRLDRPDRRDDLPVRPRGAAASGPGQGGAERGPLSLLTRDRWLEAQLPTSRGWPPLRSGRERRGGAGIPRPAIPAWDEYSADFREGVPLLRSANAAPELEPAEAMVHASSRHWPRGTWRAPGGGRRGPGRGPGHEGHAGRRIVDWLLGDDSFTPSSPGLLRYLGWTVMKRYLSPVVEAFDRWRDDERWLRRYCPMCGSLPAMAQLVGATPGGGGSSRAGAAAPLARCERTGCPFCEEDSQKLAAVTVEGEGGLRIDKSESCGGYLKTYDGQGNEYPSALGLDVPASRPHRAESRPEEGRHVALRVRAGTRSTDLGEAPRVHPASSRHPCRPDALLQFSDLPWNSFPFTSRNLRPGEAACAWWGTSGTRTVRG